ncbi:MULTISPECIES: hypothetical protein [Halomonadaceae]|uniref:hypothetical protein n=1 Tax=Halomonadaceae TaxID=28256 RepID=UPI00158339ED|nr:MULTISPECIES: hypothetical protein [Halomonas]MDI4637519.1 hypothetical protein [Halomonas sp. BMC7]NUJ61352.1 hypothetical protein [Halomonas taeanensis]
MFISESYRNSFERFSKEESQYLIDLFRGDGGVDYPFGYLFGKLTEKDTDVVNLISDLRQDKMSDESFRRFVVDLERAKNKKESESLIERIREYEELDRRDHISIKKLEFISAYLQCLDFNKVTNHYQSIYNSLNDETSIFNCSIEDYVAFKIVELLYEYYEQSLKRFSVPEHNNLEGLYVKNGISLNEVDTQYNKHQLLTIDANFEISDSNIPKVYDKRIQAYVLINEIPSELLKLFKQLKEEGLINSIALRPEYSLAGDGFIDLSIALEELERGETFSLGKLGAPSISKLYSKEYDNLWVVIDKRNITFEEIVQDFYIYNDCIVTQVVHLEYEGVGTVEPLITHIDHEYIFYTIDEYEKRQQDYTQKGNAIKRYKTFKIDNSKIPFYVSDMFILYYIIEKFFKKKELLNEYFESVLKT